MKNYIHVRDNLYKVPYTRSNGRAANTYFIRHTCTTCQVEIYQHRTNYLKSEGRGYCSPECRNKARATLDGSVKRKRSKNSSEDHTLTKAADHPNARKGWVATHRLVMERHINRLLSDEERVHHIDMVSNNNKLENLYLCANTAAHNKAHASLNSCVAELIELGVLKFKNGEYHVKNSSSRN